MQLKILGLQGATSLDVVRAATKNLNLEQLKAALSTTKLSGEKIKLILSENGVADAELENVAATIMSTAATGTATTATGLFTGATISLKTALKGLWATMKANPITAIISVVTVFISAISTIAKKVDEHFGISLKEAKNKLEEVKSECSELESELSSLNDELETTQEKIETLEAKDSLTFVEQEELDNLKATNAELKRTIKLKEILLESKNKEANTDFVKVMDEDLHNGFEYSKSRYGTSNNAEDVYDKNYLWRLFFGNNTGYIEDFNFWERIIPYIFTFGAAEYDDVDETEYIDQQFEKYKYYQKQIEELDKEYADNLTDKDYTSKRERLIKERDEIWDYLAEKGADFEEASDGIDYVPNPTTEDGKKTNAWLDYIRDFNNRLLILKNEGSTVFNSLVDGDFADVVAPLKELGEQGKVTAEDLKNPQYEDFINNLIKFGFIADATTESLEKVASAFNGKNIDAGGIEDSITKIKQAFSDSVDGDDSAKEKINNFNEWINKLSDEDKELVYNIYCNTDTAEYSLEDWQNVLNDYKENAESIPIRTDISSLWNSESFSETKEALLEMKKTLGKISPKEIEKLAEESDELSKILKQDGMDAEFLAFIFENIADGNDGLSLITDDALKLNAALNGMSDAFDEVSVAKEKYDNAMSYDEKDTNFKSLAEAYETLNQQFTEGKTNSNAFWAAAEYIFGSDKLKEFGYDVEKIYSAMQQNANIFGDSDSGGFGFLDKLYELSENGQVFNDAGEVIGEISKLSDGSYKIDIDYENIDAIADKMNLSREAVLSCLEAISMFGDINFYDIEEVLDVIEEIGIVSEVSGKKTINLDSLIKQLANLGKSEKEIEDILDGLKGLGNITFIDAEMKVDDLIDSLENLGLAAKNGATIEVDYKQLADLMKDIGFTKEQAEELVNKLGKVDSIKFTSQLGGSEGVAAVEDVLSHINSMDFTSTENEVDGVTSAVQNLTDTLNGLNGKSIFVAIDVVGSVKQIVADVKNWLGFDGYAKGTDGAPGGASLVGEEGEELVQSGNRAYLVGTNGAEIVNLKPGDKVYTASETKKIKNSGYRLRGCIPAFKDGTKGSTNGTVNNKKYNSVLPESSSNSSSSKTSSSKSDSSSKTDPKTFDWIEVSISRIERAIKRVQNTAESAYKSLKTRTSAVNKQIKNTTKEISIQEKAYKRYIQEANSVGLSDSLKKKVQNGSININEYNDETQELIESYQKWYEKALSCSDAIQELEESLSSLYEQKFENISDDYENQLAQIEHLTNTYENALSDLEARGYLGGQEYYTELQEVEKQRISLLEKELADLTSAMQTAIAKGEIEEGSESWYSMQESINDVKEEIQSANTALIEYQNSLRELDWEAFDFMQERISAITDETEFLIELLDESNLYDDKGNITKDGLAAAGLHAVSYNTYMRQSDEYAKEILKINKELADDPSNTELIERREELLELQRESILAAEKEKDSISDMIEEGINKQLDSMKELIDAYKESLQSAKDLYEYQKKIKDQTSNIASLQKQLSAYENDSSEETRAKIQKLKVELEEAQEELEETEYDKYISDTEKMLDSFYEDYEDTLNARMDNIDALISTMIDTINLNAFDISSTIKSACSDVGYTITDTMNSIWSGSGNIVSDYGDSSFGSSSTNGAIDSVISDFSDLLSAGSKIAGDVISSFTSGNSASDNQKPTPESSSKKETAQKDTVAQKDTTAKKITVGGKIDAGSAKIYTNSSGKGATNQYYTKDPIYVVLGEENGYLKVRHHKLSSGVTGWFKKSDVKAYKTGGLVDYTGLAQVDGTPGKPELVLNSKDTDNFIGLRDTLQEMAKNNVQLLSSSDYIKGLGSVVPQGILDVSSYISKYREPQENSYSVNVGDVNTTIEIDHVMNYDDFVSQIKKDPQFEGFIESITLGRLAGGSRLSKYKYWK